MAAKGSEAASKHPASDVEEAVISFVERGGTLTKLGTNGKKYKRHFFVDRKTMALCHAVSRTCCNDPRNVRTWVPIGSIEDVVRVADTEKEGPSMLTLAVRDQKKPKTLIAPSRAVRDSWADGLRCLVSAQSAMDPVKQERMWLEERFADADRNRDGQLDRDEVARLLNSLSVSPADSKVVKQRAKSEALNFDQFVELYNELSKRPELEALFDKYAVNHHYMTVDELAQFFHVEESESIPRETLEHIIRSSEPCPALRERDRLGFVGFCVMFTSPRLNVKDPRCLSVYQDMTQPLGHYFISSSHNTYLDDYQVHRSRIRILRFFFIFKI